ncbi:MAG: pilus assembly protein PilP [Calditerrivibrio sp.]|nr:pilus assembly protein PilP [Calditerrivibrio sp.]MCA1933611.1 pilus assembly protein PilP [Calditerrivibrio sp.]MCA1980638.1 pilus assembly protein PilP [Calditerrivibrio sp.]
MRVIVAILIVSLIACGSEPKKDEAKNVQKKVEPVKFDTTELVKQEEELRLLFKQKIEPLNYRPKKDPFRSVVETYKESLANQFSENPLKNATLDQITLVGVLNSKVGNVGVVEIAGQTFYVKVGDRVGMNDGVVVDVTSTTLRVRQMEKDVFGNIRATVKDITIATTGGKL